MDITETTQPRSDQLNFDDVSSVTHTVTIEEVKRGSAEQPVDVHLVEFPGRPYKPSKSMRRVLLAAWGPDTTTYTGRRMKLMGDPTVKFGGNVVGGIKIAALSDIEKPLKVQLTVTRGKRAPHVVEVLSEAPTQPPTDPTVAPVAAFAAGGVTVQQLEARIGRPRNEWTDADLTKLTDLFQALKSGQVTKDEAFPEDGAS